MNTPLFLIFIDALSSEYLKKDNKKTSPVINQNFHCISPLPAFEGIGATVFSGTWPEIHGVWTNFIKREIPRYDRSILLKSGFKTSDYIPNDRLSWDLRYLLLRLEKKPIPIPNLIPAQDIPFFDSKMVPSIFSKNAMGNIPTLFDVISKNEKTVSLIPFSLFGGDDAILNNTLKYIERGRFSDLTYLKFGSLDPIGHKFGPNSSNTKSAADFIFKSIESISHKIFSVNKDAIILLFSDHGMSMVTHHIDLIKILNNMPFRRNTDYFVFIDSTMARFWFNSEAAKLHIKERLSTIPYGRIISESDLKIHHLPVNPSELGTLIFSLNEGAMFSPDFFHRSSKLLGMHSYLENTFDNPVISLQSKNDYQIKNKNIEFVDIMPTVLHSMELPVPSSCQGKILID